MSDDNEFRRFKHWGPILLLSLALLVTWTTLHMNSMWWPPGQDVGSWVNYSLIWVHVFGTLYNFVRSLMVGPGFVPKNWHPKRLKDTKFLQFCQRCEGYKPPRSHHCRRCDRCVLKMDHHCPWINNCVGWSNHASYVYFLVFFLSGSAQGAFILTAAFIRGISKRYLINQHMEHLATVSLTWFNCVATVGSLAVTMGMGMASIKLLYMQAKVIFTNKTEIERWIIQKAEFRRNTLPGPRIKPLVYPYDLGWRGNYQEVFVPSGDGYSWPVVQGCTQYTLTVEQLAQKKHKRARARCFKCIRRVTGYYFPIISQGLWVCLQIPCNDDPRIVLQPGDLVQATRIHNNWLYGERVISEVEKFEGKKREGALRGWFPAGCAMEILAEDQKTEDNVYASGEPFPGKVKADEKLAEEKDDVLAGGEGIQNKDQELKAQDDILAGGEGIPNEDQELNTQEYDPYFKRTLEQVLKEKYDNLDDEKPPWAEEEYDLEEPYPEEGFSSHNPWEDGTRKRAL